VTEPALLEPSQCTSLSGYRGGFCSPPSLNTHQPAWARELAVMKSQCKKKGRGRGEWYAGMGACFLSKSENEMIPNGYLLVLNSLRALVKAGFLEIACERPAAFRVEFGAKARGDNQFTVQN